MQNNTLISKAVRLKEGFAIFIGIGLIGASAHVMESHHRRYLLEVAHRRVFDLHHDLPRVLGMIGTVIYCSPSTSH